VRHVTFASDIKDICVARGNSDGTAPLLTVAGGRQVTFVNIDDLTIVKQHEYPFELNSAALNQKTQRFIAGGEDFSAKVLDYETGDLLEVHKGHHGAVHCVRYAPDLETFSSSSEDGTIRLWQCEIKNYGLWLVAE
jgi:serine-threonine kinase receptor-associated protein